MTQGQIVTLAEALQTGLFDFALRRIEDIPSFDLGRTALLAAGKTTIGDVVQLTAEDFAELGIEEDEDYISSILRWQWGGGNCGYHPLLYIRNMAERQEEWRFCLGLVFDEDLKAALAEVCSGRETTAVVRAKYLASVQNDPGSPWDVVFPTEARRLEANRRLDEERAIIPSVWEPRAPQPAVKGEEAAPVQPITLLPKTKELVELFLKRKLKNVNRGISRARASLSVMQLPEMKERELRERLTRLQTFKLDVKAAFAERSLWSPEGMDMLFQLLVSLEEQEK